MTTDTAIASPTVRSERLKANPLSREYLVRHAGRDLLLTLEEARQWFQQGFDIFDPLSKKRIDIGAVAIPSYLDGRGSFIKQEQSVDEAKKKLYN